MILFGIGFNCNNGIDSVKTLFPSNSKDILIPLSFWIVNAVNSYVPTVEKNSLTLFGIVSNIPSEFDIAPTK